MNKKKDVSISIVITIQQNEYLRRRSYKERRSKSEIIRELLAKATQLSAK